MGPACLVTGVLDLGNRGIGHGEFPGEPEKASLEDIQVLTMTMTVLKAVLVFPDDGTCELTGDTAALAVRRVEW